jgi:nitrate/nitrite-specific signal transduction histidine kinase
MKTQYLNHGLLLLLGCVMTIMQPAHAAPPDEAMSRAQFMIRQISAERDQLQKDKAGLLKQVDELQKKYNGLEKNSSKTTGDMKQQFAQLRELYEAERKEHDATRTTLAAVTAEKYQLTEVASGQGQSLELCIGNNKKLYDITRNMLAAYEDKSAWDSLVQAEPLTGLSKIDIENLVDDTQYRIDDLRVNADILTNKISN